MMVGGLTTPQILYIVISSVVEGLSCEIDYRKSSKPRRIQGVVVVNLVNLTSRVFAADPYILYSIKGVLKSKTVVGCLL